MTQAKRFGSEPRRSDRQAQHGFVAYGGTPEAREAMARALDQALKTSGPDFGDAMRKAKAAIERADPLALIGAFAMYYGVVQEGTNPEFNRTNGVFWHHIELAQALAFRSVPDPSTNLTAPFEVIEDVTHCITRLTDAWMLLEGRKLQQAAPGPKRDLASVLMRLRVNAMTVRGWGYKDRSVSLLQDLLLPLDSEVHQQLGWRPSLLPAWWVAIGDTLSERLEAHRAAVREATEWPVDDQWLHRVRERFGALPVDDERKLIVATATNDEFRCGFICHSSDLRAHEIFRYSLNELTDLMPGAEVASDVVRGLLDAWSVTPGDDCGVAPGRLFLQNPVLDRPFVKTGQDEWHLFCTWLPMHNAFALLERAIGGDVNLFDAYTARRAAFLEQRVSDLLSSALPDAEVESNLLHSDPTDSKEYENDVLAILDSYAVVAEAKAGRIGPEARRGKGLHLRDRITELLEDPSEQAERLAGLFSRESKQQSFERKADGTSFVVDASRIRQTLSIGVTLEPIAGLLPKLSEVADAGLSDRAAEALIYSISLPDLELVTDILKHPSEVLHYLTRRIEIERREFLQGDEADLLGLYLQTGFNLGEKEFEGQDILDVTGMSDPIDVWHYRSEAGLKAQCPRVERTSWWEAVLTRIEERRGPRWPEIGVTLCNVPPEAQRELEQAMEQLRNEVVSGERPPTDVMVFHNGPPQRRDVFIGVIAASPDKDERARQYEQAVSVAITEHELDRVILFAWTPEEIDAPYFALVYYGSDPVTS